MLLMLCNNSQAHLKTNLQNVRIIWKWTMGPKVQYVPDSKVSVRDRRALHLEDAEESPPVVHMVLAFVVKQEPVTSQRNKEVITVGRCVSPSQSQLKWRGGDVLT